MIGPKGDSEALTRESNANKCMGSEAREMRGNKSVGRLMGINKSGSRLDIGLSLGFSVNSAEHGRHLLLGAALSVGLCFLHQESTGNALQKCPLDH